MLLYSAIYFYFIIHVRSTEDVYSQEAKKSDDISYSNRFSYWPSVHNGATIMNIRKRDVQKSVSETNEIPRGQEGQSAQLIPNAQSSAQAPQNIQKTSNDSPSVQTSQVIQSEGGILQIPKSEELDQNKPKTEIVLQQEPNSNVPVIPKNKTESAQLHVSATKNVTESKNSTSGEIATNQLDLNNPGVLKRGLIVFGGFALLAVAYFVFYRTKNKNSDTSNTHSNIEGNQFRYGVLQSDDRRDNLELSRMPLTMESEDEDDDLEIFDIEQKKKSLSYVNLQNDEEPISNFSEHIDYDRDNLLLDIEDRGSETLINWSSNGNNKSIL